MPKKHVTYSISVPYEMHEWLEKPSNKRKINKSQLFQAQVKELMNPQSTKIQPMSWLVIIMGMSFGVGCIVSASSFIWWDFMFRTTLFMLGAVAILSSLTALFIEKRKKNHATFI